MEDTQGTMYLENYVQFFFLLFSKSWVAAFLFFRLIEPCETLGFGLEGWFQVSRTLVINYIGLPHWTLANWFDYFWVLKSQETNFTRKMLCSTKSKVYLRSHWGPSKVRQPFLSAEPLIYFLITTDSWNWTLNHKRNWQIINVNGLIKTPGGSGAFGLCLYQLCQNWCLKSWNIQ